MAVCALLVIVTVSGAMDSSRFVDGDSEVARIVDELSRLIDSAGSSMAELRLSWRVPMTPTGAELRIVVDGNLVEGESGGFRAVSQPDCLIHTWTPKTECLNRSVVEDLDRSAPVLEASSGQILRIESERCMVDNSEETLVFVSLAR